MSENNEEKSPGDTFNELKTMVQSYAQQEVKGPLQNLAQWVKFGVVGAVLVAIGLAYVAFGALRFFQSEVGAFDDGLSFVPYLIAFAVLLVAIGLSGWAMVRTFGDDD